MAGGKRDKLILVDGHSLLYRAYYALPPLATADGTPTHAVYGLAMMLTRLIDDERPDAILVAFDRSGPTFRHEAYPEYKGERPEMPADLRSQVPLARELIEAFAIPACEAEGYEADDVIGTLAARGEEEGMEVVVVTGDMDALQLVSDRVDALITRKGIREMERFDREGVRRRLGVGPEQVADWKGLVGDASDNIPGVPGIGAKTATKLLSEYGSLEELLSRLDEVGGRPARLLREHAEIARKSKDLARIARDAPVSLPKDAMRYRGPDAERLAALYRRLEFRTLLDRLVASHPELSQGRRGPARRRGPSGTAGVRRLDPEKELDLLLAFVEAQEELALEVAPGSHDGEAAGLAFAGAEEAVYLPLPGLKDPAPSGTPGEKLPESLGRALHRALGPDAPRLILHDAKRAEGLLGPYGFSFVAVRHDLMLAGYLIAPGQGDYSLEDLSVKYGKEDPPPLSEEAPPEEEARAMGERAILMARLAPGLERRLEKDGLIRLYEEVELPLARVLARMERRGIRLDVARLEEIGEAMERRIEAAKEAIYEHAGERFNLNSPRQLAHVLFERLGLPVLRRTKSGPSTGADVLARLAEDHPVAACILEYREAQKLKSTYVETLPAMVRPETGRVHTTFLQTATATGRLASANPNLQNIPIRTEAGREIRRAFVAEEGRTFLKADYSQIELRLAAHLSQDPGLIEAFAGDADIHTRTAAEIFGVAPEKVSPTQRSAAKAVNFGIVYGISSFGLARDTGLSQAQAQDFIDRYFERYPGLAAYMENVVEGARRDGYVTTLMGRRRYLPELQSKQYAVRRFAERTAVNTPVQGSAADVIKKAMVAAERRIEAEGVRADLLLQVHDELVLEVDLDHLERAARLLKEEMEGVVELSVPLKVEMAHGPNWLDGSRLDV